MYIYLYLYVYMIISFYFSNGYYSLVKIHLLQFNDFSALESIFRRGCG